jgi:hypothetical protein
VPISVSTPTFGYGETNDRSVGGLDSHAATGSRRDGVGLGVALAGRSSDDGASTTRAPESTVTGRLRNRDDERREYEVVVNQGESVTDSFSGVLPADQEQYVEMVATFRATDEQHDLTISVAGGQRGRLGPDRVRRFRRRRVHRGRRARVRDGVSERLVGPVRSSARRPGATVGYRTAVSPPGRWRR